MKSVVPRGITRKDETHSGHLQVICGIIHQNRFGFRFNDSHKPVQKNKTMQKTVLTYGFISGAIAAALMVCTGWYYSQNPDFTGGEVFGYVGILLSMLFVFLGVRSYRDTVQEGRITFGKAFQIGLLITLISCVCYVITWMFVYETMMPDFMEKYAAHTLESMRQSGATAEAISAETQKMEEFKVMYQNPLSRFALTFLEPFPVGLLVTLVSAAVLRKQTV
jgi:hypothetical protein